ncbi:MAG: helix-turn-helix transcriptional regulator [Flavobacteriales bacterium]|nr:helix-turn-helix transcriptional regulator [Flavobacteriales bacterium]
MLEVVSIRDVKVQLGNLVKKLRKKEGLSQVELADLLGLSRITVQNLESGQNFTIDTLLKVVHHFNLLEELNRTINQKINDTSINPLY